MQVVFWAWFCAYLYRTCARLCLWWSVYAVGTRLAIGTQHEAIDTVSTKVKEIGDEQ